MASTVPQLTLPNVLAGQTVYIGVGGVGSNTTFTVRAHEVYAPTSHHAPMLLTLLDGQPQNDAILNSASSDWLYYVISAPLGHEQIIVRSTSTIGNSDLFALKCEYNSLSLCAQHLPNATHFQLSTAGLDKDILYIIRNDPADSFYIVGVLSTSYTAAYSINARFLSTTQELQPGFAVMDHVDKGGVDYFSFYFNQVETGIKFVLTPVSSVSR
jgi:hypothetical protein